MVIVVADTGPINYLVLIDAIDLLPRLFDRVCVPRTVFRELTDPDTPARVREWMTKPPPWFAVHADPEINDDTMATLDAGERAAITLSVQLEADLLLMDERAGVALARRMGLATTGTLGVLDLASRQGLLDLAQAFTRLKATSFHYRQGLLDTLLARHQPIR